MSNRSFKPLAQQLIKELNQHDLGAYLWSAATTGSCYIRFADSRMCSIRIGDHDGREKYKYKFNLRSDISKAYSEKDNGIIRFYFPINDTAGLMAEVLKRKEAVMTWTGESKFTYGIPSFKKQHLNGKQKRRHR
jgi:hypothetical protein